MTMTYRYHSPLSTLFGVLFGILFSFATGTTARAQNARGIVKILENGPPKTVKAKKETRPTATSAAAASSPIFFLRDNSKVAGDPAMEHLQVRTRYGLLNVPMKELVRVRFVQRIDPSIKMNVNESIQKLGDEDFDVREDAMDKLRAIGPASLPFLREAMESDNEETQNRAEILVDELEEEEKKSSAKTGDSIVKLKGKDDEIITTRMTIRGFIELESIQIISRYGKLMVAIADLEAITFQKVGPSSKSVDVLPKFQPPGNWMDTKISLEVGQRFRLQASGSINISNYGVNAGPTGTRQWSSNGAFGNFAMLALVGKIGKKGKAFLVGNEYKGKSKKGGRLYLAIVPFSYNPAGAVGKFTTKIKLMAEEY